MFFPFSTHDQTNPLIKLTNILINVDNHNIEFVPETKTLAATLDYKIKFDQHVNIFLKKVNAKTLLISRNWKMFSCNFRTTLFKLFIMPNFEYCSSLFTYTTNIHSHPKKYGFGFWVWVWVYTQNPYPKNPKNLGKTQNPYPKTQIFWVYTQNPYPKNPKKFGFG